jgi:hypothetical protein
MRSSHITITRRVLDDNLSYCKVYQLTGATVFDKIYYMLFKKSDQFEAIRIAASLNNDFSSTVTTELKNVLHLFVDGKNRFAMGELFRRIENMGEVNTDISVFLTKVCESEKIEKGFFDFITEEIKSDMKKLSPDPVVTEHYSPRPR